jgi:phosphoenolpyruvate carboxylase
MDEGISVAQADIMSPSTPSRRTLSDDVYLLAGLLGEVLRGSGGERAFVQTETARTLAKNLRQATRRASSRCTARLADDGETLVALLPTISRLTRGRQRANTPHPQSRGRRRLRHGSLEAVRLLADHGIDAGQLTQLLSDAQIRLVLTAHPTEARRRTVIAKLGRISGILRDLDERLLMPDEAERARQRLAHTIEEVWYSEEVRAAELTVSDEVRTALCISTFADVVPRLYRDLEEAISAVYPHHEIVVPPLLIPGTWIGGDRDGNPNVTPEVTRQALNLLRSAAIGLLDERLLELAGRLSVAESISGPAPLLDPLIKDLADRFPEMPGSSGRALANLIDRRQRDAPAAAPGEEFAGTRRPNSSRTSAHDRPARPGADRSPT